MLGQEMNKQDTGGSIRSTDQQVCLTVSRARRESYKYCQLRQTSGDISVILMFGLRHSHTFTGIGFSHPRVYTKSYQRWARPGPQSQFYNLKEALPESIADVQTEKVAKL
jgi:hypothetical protein